MTKISSKIGSDPFIVLRMVKNKQMNKPTKHTQNKTRLFSLLMADKGTDYWKLCFKTVD